MRRMYSENQIVKEIQDNVASVVEGKFFPIIEAPSSTTLSEDELEAIVGGCQINDTFLNLIRPVFFPARKISSVYRGLVIGFGASGSMAIRMYEINSSGVISNYSGKQIDLISIDTINGKSWPANPSNTGTFVLKCIDGTLTWVAEE